MSVVSQDEGVFYEDVKVDDGKGLMIAAMVLAGAFVVLLVFMVMPGALSGLKVDAPANTVSDAVDVQEPVPEAADEGGLMVPPQEVARPELKDLPDVVDTDGAMEVPVSSGETIDNTSQGQNPEPQMPAAAPVTEPTLVPVVQPAPVQQRLCRPRW